MRTRILFYLLTLFATSASTAVFAQGNPVKWSYAVKTVGECQLDLIFTGVLEEGWSTYSQFLESEDGPVATTLNFELGPHFKLLGKATESGEIVKSFEPIFNMELTKFKHKAILTQRVEVLDPRKPIVANVNFMACNHEMCLPPKDADFSINIPVLKNCSANKSSH